MNRKLERLGWAFMVSVLWGATVAGENWPEFRGPGGQGHATESDLPVEWDESRNVTWKQAIPGEGWSSPIFYEGHLFLTTALPVDANDPQQQSLRALCLYAATGTSVWDVEVFHLISENQLIR